jgi:hypothetical protein
VSSCSQGTLYAGVPQSNGNPTDRATSGSAILSDPPVQWQTLVFVGSELFTRQEGEIWGVDTSAAAPVQTKLAGTTATGSTYDFSDFSTAVPCASAVFTLITGIAAMPDGSLVVADYWASSILQITNPTKSTCSVKAIAGNTGPFTGIDPSDTTTYAPSGNMNGAGSAASFYTLGAMTVDAAGNIYVTDADATTQAALVRKVATASSDTVTTLHAFTGTTDPDRITNYTMIGDKLYAAGGDAANNSYVLNLDTTSGTVTPILTGGADMFPPVDSASDPEVSGITTDGTNLLIAGDGYVWSLTLAGQLTLLAGTGPNICNFPTGYDPTMPQPAMSLALPTVIGSADEFGRGSLNHITYHNGAIYFRGFADGVSAFVEKIACP